MVCVSLQHRQGRRLHSSALQNLHAGFGGRLGPGTLAGNPSALCPLCWGCLALAASFGTVDSELSQAGPSLPCHVLSQPESSGPCPVEQLSSFFGWCCWKQPGVGGFNVVCVRPLGDSECEGTGVLLGPAPASPSLQKLLCSQECWELLWSSEGPGQGAEPPGV